MGSPFVGLLNLGMGDEDMAKEWGGQDTRSSTSHSGAFVSLPFWLFNDECASHARVATHLAREQIGAGRRPKQNFQPLAWRDAKMIGRPDFTREGD